MPTGPTQIEKFDDLKSDDAAVFVSGFLTRAIHRVEAIGVQPERKGNSLRFTLDKLGIMTYPYLPTEDLEDNPVTYVDAVTLRRNVRHPRAEAATIDGLRTHASFSASRQLAWATRLTLKPSVISIKPSNTVTGGITKSPQTLKMESWSGDPQLLQAPVRAGEAPASERLASAADLFDGQPSAARARHEIPVQIHEFGGDSMADSNGLIHLERALLQIHYAILTKERLMLS